MKTILRLAAVALLTLELLAVGAAREETIQMREARTAHFRALGAADERLNTSLLALAFAAPDEWATYAKAQPAFLLEQLARATPDLLTAPYTHKAAAISAMEAISKAAPYKMHEFRSAMLAVMEMLDPLPLVTEESAEWMFYLQVLRIERNLRALLKATAPDEWAAYEAAKTSDHRRLAKAERSYETALLAVAFAAPDEWATCAEASAVHFVVSLIGSDADKSNVLGIAFSALIDLGKAAPDESAAFFEAREAYKTVRKTYSATTENWRLYLEALDIERGCRMLLKAMAPDEWAAYEAGWKKK